MAGVQWEDGAGEAFCGTGLEVLGMAAGRPLRHACRNIDLQLRRLHPCLEYTRHVALHSKARAWALPQHQEGTRTLANFLMWNTGKFGLCPAASIETCIETCF